MRSLKRLNPEVPKDARPSMCQSSTETNTFKRDIQLLEKVILKKLDEKPISSGNLLAVLFDEQSALIGHLTPHWQHREVLRAIRSVRQEIGRRDGEAQYDLPGFEEFPARVRVGGSQPYLAAMRVAGTVEYLESLESQEKSDGARIAKVRILVGLMKKYSRHEPEITVREVCERERE